MPKFDLQPRKTPLQQRSHLMVEMILEAAARVLRKESLAGFNTNRVAEVADISVGSLYQYFPNKAALVVALVGHAHDQLATSVEALVKGLSGATLAQTLRAVAALAVRQQYGDPVLAAALDHEERRLPTQSGQLQARARLLKAVQKLIQQHRAELAPRLPRSTAHDCLAITKALVEADSQSGKAPPRDLEERIARVLYGCLTAQLPRR